MFLPTTSTGDPSCLAPPGSYPNRYQQPTSTNGQPNFASSNAHPAVYQHHQTSATGQPTSATFGAFPVGYQPPPAAMIPSSFTSTNAYPNGYQPPTSTTTGQLNSAPSGASFNGYQQTTNGQPSSASSNAFPNGYQPPPAASTSSGSYPNGYIPPTSTTGHSNPASPGAYSNWYQQPTSAAAPPSSSSAYANEYQQPAMGLPSSASPGSYANGYQPQPSYQQPYPGFPQFPQQQPPALMSSNLPCVVQVTQDDQQTRSGLFPTGYPTAELPPMVSTKFDAQDYGNSNPKFIRSSLYAVPATHDFIKQSQIPLALSITPFAKLSSNEYKPPVVDLGELGPVRCDRCKAYICPFMEFIDGGRKFKCPFCYASTQVEQAYFAHLDQTGRRTDIQHRQELCLGSYEFVATKLYCKNSIPPKQPAFIFFLDVSYNAVRMGLVDLFCRQLPLLLKKLPKDYNQDTSSMRIGFATYDQTLHFYNLRNPKCAEMLIENDASDVFVPFVEGFLVDFNQAEEALKCCLEQVRKCFMDTRITETLLGPVIQAGMDALRSADCAGKIFVFHTSLPTFDAPGKLKNREDRKMLGSDKEKTQLLPDIEFYSQLGEECIKIGCAVDLFLFPNSYLDLASIAPVCNLSGGSIYKYQFFDGEREGPRFLADLQHDISREIVFDVMMRVRTSTGIRPTGFYGDFFMQNTTDIEAGALDADKGMIVECNYDDKLNENIPAFFQTAVLFTSCSGQRRLRIHNLALPITKEYDIIFRRADLDTVVTYFFKYAAKLIREKTPKEVRDELFHRCSQILSTYRERCSLHSPTSQLVLPEVLKLLPLYMNCIFRTDALNGGNELTVDDRVWLLQMVSSFRIDISMRLLYPQILPLSNFQISEYDSQLIMPTPVRASYEYFDPKEVYLVENGLVGFIWIGLEAPVEFIHDVFNVQSLQHLDTESHILPERDNARSRAVRILLADINADRPTNFKIFIVKQNDSMESWMKKFLVEDKYAANSVSYIDFIRQIHREVRNHAS